MRWDTSASCSRGVRRGLSRGAGGVQRSPANNGCWGCECRHRPAGRRIPTPCLSRALVPQQQGETYRLATVQRPVLKTVERSTNVRGFESHALRHGDAAGSTEPASTSRHRLSTAVGQRFLTTHLDEVGPFSCTWTCTWAVLAARVRCQLVVQHTRTPELPVDRKPEAAHIGVTVAASTCHAPPPRTHSRA